jgi:hypothetical protein
MMDRILAGLDFVQCYIDDIVVYSDTMEEHHIHLQIVFERLKAHGLRLHPRKCKLFQESVEYLGHTQVVWECNKSRWRLWREFRISWM